MFTFRPLPELEEQLDFLSQSTGHSKNTILNMALAQYLKTIDLNRIPLKEKIIESEPNHLVQHKAYFEQYKHAHTIADWINTNAIWTAKPGLSYGELTAAIYGRNIVVGFTDSFKPEGKNRENKLYVISKNLRSTGMGTDSHHMYVTPYEEWIKYMYKVETCTVTARDQVPHAATATVLQK